MDYVNNGDSFKMSEEAERRRSFAYLRDLYPMELVDRKKTMQALSMALLDKINVDEPSIILFSEKIPKSVYAAVLRAIDLKTPNKTRQLTWQRTTISHGTEMYLKEDYLDVSSEFNNCDILFVDMNINEVRNNLYPFIARSYAEGRKALGLKTYFFFYGTRADLNSNKWLLCDEPDRESSPRINLSNFINIIDLNKILKRKKDD